MEDKERKQGLRLLHSLPEEEPDIWGMNPAELRDYLDRLYALRKDLDSREPGDEESEEYDDWADAHEDLEDRIDEVLDRLDELK